MLAAWNQRKQARATTCGSCSPPCSASNPAEISPDSANTFSAAATSGMTCDPGTVEGRLLQVVAAVVGAKSRSAICCETSRNASNVSRECSANRSRPVSASTSSHS